MKRFSAFTLGFLFTFFGIIIALVLVFYVTSPDRYNVLVIGSDQRGTERARSDVLFIVSIPKNGSEPAYFVSVPRDTKIEHEEYGLQKITHFYALGDRPDDGKILGNRDLTVTVVEKLLDLHVDATVEVTFQSFQDLIDTLGGVSLHGQPATGEEALAVVRDRFTEGRSDFDRQADEREIFRQLLTKAKNPKQAKVVLNYFKTADDARLEYKKVKLLRFGVGAMIARGGKMEIGEMQEESLPGASAMIYTPDFGKELYYWVVDEEATKKLVDERLR